MPASLRTVLIAVAAVLALVGVTGVATGAADNDSGHVAAVSSRTTTTLRNTDSNPGSFDDVTTTLPGVTTTVGKTTGTTAKGGATATTVVSSESNACAAPDGPGAPANSTAPAVGVYSYVNCSDGSAGTDSKVEVGSAVDGKTRRRVTVSRQGSSITEIRSYTDGAVTLEGLDIASPYGTIHCDINPDVVETPGGLAKGKQWSGSGSCDQPAPIGKITFSGSGKVTGAKTVTIGGTAVQVWVIETTLKVTAAGQTQNTSAISYYDPSRGIDVYQQATVSGTTIQMRLASLTPRAA